MISAQSMFKDSSLEFESSSLVLHMFFYVHQTLANLCLFIECVLFCVVALDWLLAFEAFLNHPIHSPRLSIGGHTIGLSRPKPWKSDFVTLISAGSSIADDVVISWLYF